MALKKYSKEQVLKMSMIEVANQVLSEKKEALNFKELFDLVADHKDFTEAEKDDLLARFYTDLNIDGRFTTLGSNLWGLKRWYPVDQTSEKSLAEARKREIEEEEELLAEELEEVEDVDVADYDAVDEVDEFDDTDDIEEEFEGLQVNDEYDDN
ncbi:MAG TPA: DNA-directed RNA polymerase subunit delta [Pseudogracilibacillus sp.]|nr:DNA-directed RNA polymerase subunit delta [Pseudogracilibacillus sp.]